MKPTLQWQQYYGDNSLQIQIHNTAFFTQDSFLYTRRSGINVQVIQWPMKYTINNPFVSINIETPDDIAG